MFNLQSNFYQTFLLSHYNHLLPELPIQNSLWFFIRFRSSSKQSNKMVIGLMHNLHTIRICGSQNLNQILYASCTVLLIKHCYKSQKFLLHNPRPRDCTLWKHVFFPSKCSPFGFWLILAEVYLKLVFIKPLNIVGINHTQIPKI